MFLFHQHDTVNHSDTQVAEFLQLFHTLAEVPIVRTGYCCFPWQYQNNLKPVSNDTVPQL